MTTGSAPDETRALLDRLRSLGLAANEVRYPIAPPQPLGDAFPTRGDTPLLALAPFANRPANRWSLTRFGEVLDRWLAAGGRAFVLGGKGDRPGAAELVEGRAGVSDLTGATTLREAHVLLGRADVLLGTDTGLVHLAAAAGTPTVVVTAARDVPGRWAPHGEHHRVLREDLSCSPCWRDACPVEGRCLAAIDTEQVWSALSPHLARAAEACSKRDLEAPAPALPGGDTRHPVQGARQSGR